MSNTLKLGNGKWATGKDTVLAFNDENNNFKPLPFSFSRASSGTVVNKSGLIETVGSGEPRIDFKDNTKGALLLEPTRTNSLLQSNQFDTTWINSNTTETSGQIGIGGSSDAWKIDLVSAGGYISQDISQTGVNTISVYAKAGNLNWMRLRVGTAPKNSRYFDLKNGVIGSSGTTPLDAKIEAVGNGWYRCSMTTNISINRVWFYPVQDDGDLTATSGNIYIQHAQLEVGSYATSYIPTSGSAVTRVADVCNNGGNDQVINSTEGVLYANFYAEANDTEKWISLSDGTSTNRVIVYIPIANTLRIYVQNSSGAQADFGSSITLGQYNKVAFKYKNNDFALFLNGTKVGTDTNGGVPIGLDRLNFADSNGTTNPFIGNVKDVRVYNTALTDQELIALTS